MTSYTCDATAIEQIADKMSQYGAGSGQVINDVLHGDAAEVIKAKIAPLIPISGRKWKGKAMAASKAMPKHFSQINGSLSVTIAAEGKWSYLYFPDDGSNTKRHAGGQHFMKRGGEAAMPKVVELCTKALTENLTKG